MKKLALIFVLAVFASTIVFPQRWVKSFGSKQGTTEIAGVATDAENQAIIVGTFSSESLEIDDVNNLYNNGISDVFLIKYDTSGNLLWKLSFGGEKEEYVNGICLDDQENIYITGHFRSSSFSIGDKTISSAWPDNIYIAKFSPEGTLSWFSHSTGLTTYAWPSSVRYGGEQGILFSGSTSAANVSFGDTDLSVNSGYYKGYYGRIDKNGNFLDAGLVGEVGEYGSQYRFNDITSDAQGNLYIAGSKTIRIDPDPITWSDYRDVMYLCRIGPDGETDWVIEDTTLHRAERIIRNHDSLVVAASLEEYRNIFNGGTIDTTSAFYYGIYDLEGTRHWGKKHIGALAYDACARGGSIIVMGGLLKDHLDLGEGFQLDRNADSSSICPIYQDIFYLEVDKSGSLEQASSISGSLEDIPTSVWLAGNGDLYYSGIFESYRLNVEEKEIINNAELSVFQHVSGTYYDRSIYTFLARSPAFGPPAGTTDPLPVQFRLYPNPAKGQVYIDLDSVTGAAGIRIYDIAGRMVGSVQAFSTSAVVDLSTLAPGMYIVAVTAGNKTGHQRLIVSGL